jgi:peroxiredoxin
MSMNSRTTFAALLLAITAVAEASVKVGEPAPLFVATDSKGQRHSLEDFRGKVVVLEWTNHDCPYVRKHYGAGNMQKQQRTATEQGAVWLSVISSAPGKQGYVSGAEADRLTEQRDAAPTAVLMDTTGTIGRTYGAKTTPHMYVIDQQGILVYMGGIDSISSANTDDIPKATQYVNAALDEVMSGQAVSQPVTRPYGCSVKY